MYYEENVNEVIKSLDHLRESGVYDVDKLTYSLVHLTSQLEFFYCNLVTLQLYLLFRGIARKL